MANRVARVIGQHGYGGAEGQLFHLAVGLAGGAYTPTVYCLSDRMEPYGRWLDGLGIRVRQLGGSSDASRTLALTRSLRADAPDIVHSFLYIANRYAFLASRLAGTRTLITSARNCKREAQLTHWLLDRAAFRASTAIVCNSATVAEYIARVYGAPPDRATVSYNGVDLDRFQPHSNGNGNGASHPPTIGAISRVTAQKNPGLFLAAAAALLERRPDCRFVVVGDGDGLPAAKQEAARLGIAHAVNFLGARTDVKEILQQLDVFWLTSKWEGTPNSLLEAMANGLPVVATDVGACREVIQDGVSGFLVASGDCEALVDRTERLLGDGAMAARMATRAREEVTTRFALDRMVRSTADLYTKCLAHTVH
jgi:glycosyltransferase involved in cell wall biosynthesis